MRKENVKMILFPIIVVAMVVGIWIAAFSGKDAITPATVEQAEAILKENGLASFDMTGEYQQSWQAEKFLKHALICEDGDFQFEFFLFDSDGNAEYVRKALQSAIKEKGYAAPNKEAYEAGANYVLYWLKAEGIYTVDMRVGNTLVYAYCQEEDAGRLKQFMAELGYFEK